MRANVNVARKQRHTRTLENFKGVDLSSSPLRVSTSRATYMRNMMSENGANHKRPGWRELFRLEGKINGVFPFTESGEGDICEVLLVHAGTQMHRAVKAGETWESALLYTELPDAPMQCFYRDGRAYLVGHGAYVVYGEFDGTFAVKDVSEIAYVPTTTINKTAGEQGYGQVLDAVNLLTPWRKNTVVIPGLPTGTYVQLDGEPDPKSDVTVNVEIYQHSAIGHVQHIYSGTIVYKGHPFEGEADLEDTQKCLSAWKVDVTHRYTTEEASFVTWHEDKVEKWGGRPKVAVDLQGRIFSSAGFYKYIDEYKSVTAEVIFRITEDHSEKLKHCTVGTLFDLGGANDRLFLAGNPDEKGVDRWSEVDDFTYFPDGNAMFVGNGDTAITGYARLSDNTLAIFKESAHGSPMIYYRTGAEKTITDADGTQIPVQYFPVTAGVIGVGIISPRASGNLDGDALFLSETGVYGVELSENVSSGERYAKERSRAIREALCKRELASSVATVHRGKYYLCVGDGICFVADGRYHAIFEGTPDVGYEWWVWDHVPAVCFSQLDGALCFGTADGRVCTFVEGTFSDVTLTQARSGDLLGDTEANRVTYGNITVHEDDVLTLDGAGSFTVTDLDEAAQSFALLDENGDTATVPTGLITGVIEHAEPVVAEWASPVMDLGTSTARKTLLSLGVVLEPGTSAPVEILLQTRDGVQSMRAQNGQDLDFGALDLSDVSFAGSFAAGHVRRMNLRNFNFIQARMRSVEPQDMAVAAVTLEYKINQTQRGYY